MKTTIISICYKLRKDITDDYLIQIKRLLIIKNPIVIYTDEYCFDFIFKIRKDYGYSEITKIILVPFNETFFYKYKNKIIENRLKYNPTKDDRAPIDVHIIQLEKFNACYNTIKNNFFNTDYFCFMDINLLNKKPWNSDNYTNDNVYHKLYYILYNPKNKVSVNILNYFNLEMYNDLHNFYKSYKYICAGGFLTFDKICGLEAFKKIIDYAIYTTEQGYGHGEEHFYGKILLENPDLFNVSFGDYQDLIENYYENKTNLNYVNKIIALYKSDSNNPITKLFL